MALNLKKLNPQQREAVLHGQGPLLILAGAGSGKTSTMTYRIAHLVAERGVPSSAILGLSFTNKAAGELKERVKKLVSESAGVGATRDLTISTFHSLCVRILRAHGSKLGFRPDFTILDQSDQKDVLRQVMKNIKIDERKFDLDVILFEIGQAKNQFKNPEGAEQYFLESGRLKTDYGIAAASSYGRYQEQLRALNSMDFDDLLFNATQLLEKHEEAREFYNRKFKYILVDEYQDTNPAQFKLLSLLTEHQQNLCVVGDDDQSIYAWRGADPSHILGFREHFPKARTIVLDQNYRSTTTILDAANHVIKNNRKRLPKSLWSDRGQGEPLTEIVLENDREEAKFVADEVNRLAKEQNRPWKDFAVLYRSNAQSRIFEEEFRLNRIPYHIVGGYSFLDRKEVKNTLAWWRLALNPYDDASLRRVINWPARGIGRTALETLSTHAFNNDSTLFQTLTLAGTLTPKCAAAAASVRELILGMRSELDSISGALNADTISKVVSWAHRSIELARVRAGIEEDGDEPALTARRWENVEELLHALGQTPASEIQKDEKSHKTSVGVLILREFLTRMTLDAKEEEEEEDEKKEGDNEVTFLTLHGSKGLEYPVVFLVGIEDGFLPHQRSIDAKAELDEERRLCYVGITRARDRLYLTRAKFRVRFGKEITRTRSRFAEEIPESLLIRRDESSQPTDFSDAAREQHEQKVKSYLEQIKGNLKKR